MGDEVERAEPLKIKARGAFATRAWKLEKQDGSEPIEDLVGPKTLKPL